MFRQRKITLLIKNHILQFDRQQETRLLIKPTKRQPHYQSVKLAPNRIVMGILQDINLKAVRKSSTPKITKAYLQLQLHKKIQIPMTGVFKLHKNKPVT